MNTPLKIPSSIFTACMYTFYVFLQLYRLYISHFVTPIRKFYTDPEWVHFYITVKMSRVVWCYRNLDYILTCLRENVVILRHTRQLWGKVCMLYHYNLQTKYNILHLYQDGHFVQTVTKKFNRTVKNQIILRLILHSHVIHWSQNWKSL